MTARVASLSILAPKLLQPMPAMDTSRPERPSLRVFIFSSLRLVAQFRAGRSRWQGLATGLAQA
jgi:hypothetical protein